MLSSLKNLIKYAEEHNLQQFKHQVIKAILKHSIDQNEINLAQNSIGNHILINLLELESLIKPEKYNLPNYEVGLVGVEQHE